MAAVSRQTKKLNSVAVTLPSDPSSPVSLPSDQTDDKMWLRSTHTVDSVKRSMTMLQKKSYGLCVICVIPGVVEIVKVFLNLLALIFIFI